MNFLYNLIRKFYINLYQVLAVISIYGALSNFLNSTTKLSLSIIFLGITIIFILFSKNSFQTKRFLNYFDFEINLYLFFVFIFIIQYLIIFSTSFGTDWDVGGIYTMTQNILVDRDSTFASNYLSVNPNNSFFFFIMFAFSLIENILTENSGTSWAYWQILNSLTLNIGAVLLYKGNKHLFGRKVANIGLLFSIFLLIISPHILIPYTDSFAFTVVSATIYIFSNPKLSNTCRSILFGLFSAIGYLLKPNLLIIPLAHKINSIMNAKIKFKKCVISLITFLLLIFSFNTFKNQQNIISYDSSRKKVWPLFIMMGMKGDGGYSNEDTVLITQIDDPTERMEVGKKIIAKRLQEYGPLGYGKFLLKKQKLNTEDGSFFYGREGSASSTEIQQRESFYSKIINDFFSVEGEFFDLWKNTVQIIWIILLIGSLLVTLTSQNQMIDYLTLATLGFFLFLLFFEAGRSRYLIQFLPLIITLGSSGWMTVLNNKFNEEV